MDAINNKDTSSNRMQKYVEGNNGYISPTTSSGYLNQINSKSVNDTETMDFTDIDVDSILAEEDPYADESNKISSKPVYGKTFGTDIKFTKGYNNVYDASSESNVINLNTNIVFDGDSRIKQVKAFDTNGTLVDLHIDINDDMNIDDIMQKVYESATAMGIPDDKIIIDISDQKGNSRAWVRAEDILLKDKVVSKTDDNIKIEEPADDVINDLPHNISDVDNARNEVDNNQDTVSNTTNSFFSDIKNTFTKIANSLSNVAVAKMEKANKTAKAHEEMYKTANDIIKNKIDSGMDYLKSFGNNINNIDKENLKINKDLNNAAEFLSSGAIAISDSFHGFIADSSKLLENANDWLVNDALPVIEDISSTVSNVLKRTYATVGTVRLSLVEGIGELGEAIVDAGATILTGAASIITLVVDGGGYLYSDITGKEWNSVTEYMWNTTKAFVAKKHVANWFDSLYENSAAGRWLKTNAFFFDNVREVSSGIGYTVGIIGLTLATGGVGGIAGGTAGVAGIAGVGKGVEDAWGKGASTFGGLTSGALNGLWEGFQFFVGAKINGINVFGKSAPTIKTKLVNSLIHVALDGVDGGSETFARTLIDTCYKDGYTDTDGNYIQYSDTDSILKRLQENFDDLGGFNNVLTGALSGAATSALSEALDLGKYFKDSKNSPNINISEQELQVKIDRYNELLDIKNSEDYLSYMDKAKKGYTQELNLEFEGIEKEFATLEYELSLIAGIPSEVDADIPKIMDEVETEKMFDYDGNQPTLDMFATEKMASDMEATLDMVVTEKIVPDNTSEAKVPTGISNQLPTYLSFSKESSIFESIKQLSDYYGDAGSNINYMFKKGKTANQILDELDGQEKIDFQNFLQNTRQGQYLASLSDAEIHAMTTYTGGSYTKINGMLRDKKIGGKINGMSAQSLIDNMDAAIAKYGGLETSTEIYRAVGVDAFKSKNSPYTALFNGIDVSDLNQVYSVLKVLEGKDFGDLGYMSTSPAYSTSFAKYGTYPIVLDIIADEGTPGAYINQISEYYNEENEFLLARDTVLQMVEVLAPEKDINGLEKIVVRCVVK